MQKKARIWERNASTNRKERAVCKSGRVGEDEERTHSATPTSEVCTVSWCWTMGPVDSGPFLISYCSQKITMRLVRISLSLQSISSLILPPLTYFYFYFNPTFLLLVLLTLFYCQLILLMAETLSLYSKVSLLVFVLFMIIM